MLGCTKNIGRNGGLSAKQPHGVRNDCYKLDYNILAAHIDAQWRMMPHVFLNISTRTEYMAHANWLFMPRATLCYIPNKNFQLSFATGRYSQTPEDDYLATNKKSLGQSTADHAILSIQYKSPGTLIRIEPYWKISAIAFMGKGIYQPKGYGKSKGIDIFVEEHSLFKHLTTAFHIPTTIPSDSITNTQKSEYLTTPQGII